MQKFYVSKIRVWKSRVLQSSWFFDLLLAATASFVESFHMYHKHFTLTMKYLTLSTFYFTEMKKHITNNMHHNHFTLTIEYFTLSTFLLHWDEKIVYYKMDHKHFTLTMEHFTLITFTSLRWKNRSLITWITNTSL